MKKIFQSNITKKSLAMLAKIILVVLILALLVKFKIIEAQFLFEILNHPFLIAVIVLIFFGTFVMNVVRWRWILNSQGLDLNFLSLLRAICFGAFSNIFLPGGSSGDAVRFLYILKKFPDSKTAAGSSIIIDRLLGISGLIIATILIIIANFKTIENNTFLSHLAFVTCSMFAAGILTIVIIFGFSKYLQNIDFIKFKKSKNFIWLIIYNLLDITSLYRTNRSKILAGLGISVVIHLLILYTFILIALTLKIGSLSALDYSIAAPFSILANTLPITPGGIGIGEGTFNYICRNIDPAALKISYGNIFFIFRALSVLAMILSIIPFIIIYRKTNDTP